jgi:VanZ family protein
MPDFGLGFEDKIIHLCAFGGLGFLTHRALSRPTPLTRWVSLWTFLLSAAYAYSDEAHQRFVPGRTYDLWDYAFDVVGIGLALSVIAWRERSNPPKSRKSAP